VTRHAKNTPLPALSPEQVEQIARVVHGANIELQKVHGDALPSLPWDAESEETRQGAIRGVERALTGVTPEELHAGWCSDMAEAGWQQGPVKDRQARTHPCLVPYAGLPAHQKAKDAVFLGIVQAMAANMIAGDPR
jgi:hypothetical protein